MACILHITPVLDVGVSGFKLVSFQVIDTAGNTLPPHYRMRAACGIPKDVVTLQPGPFSVTCNLAEMFPPEV